MCTHGRRKFDIMSHMKYFSILEPTSKEYIKITAKELGFSEDEYSNYVHPQEDYLSISEKYPIYVVADGVTLIQNLIDRKIYPNPSPAGEVAKIFCETVVKEVENGYENFKKSDLKKIFRTANKAVGDYNMQHGRTKESVDYWNNDFYAATGAFAIIKDDIAYWASICDSYVMYFGKDEILFKSPACDKLADIDTPRFEGELNDRKSKIRYTWSVRRNGMRGGKRIGYGVITGEPEAENYLCTGGFRIHNGDLIAILTDGFEEFMGEQDFMSLFRNWPTDLESQVKKYTEIRSHSDPDRFGHERSLIVVGT